MKIGGGGDGGEGGVDGHGPALLGLVRGPSAASVYLPSVSSARSPRGSVFETDRRMG